MYILYFSKFPIISRNVQLFGKEKKNISYTVYLFCTLKKSLYDLFKLCDEGGTKENNRMAQIFYNKSIGTLIDNIVYLRLVVHDLFLPPPPTFFKGSREVAVLQGTTRFGIIVYACVMCIIPMYILYRMVVIR